MQHCKDGVSFNNSAESGQARTGGLGALQGARSIDNSELVLRTEVAVHICWEKKTTFFLPSIVAVPTAYYGPLVKGCHLHWPLCYHSLWNLC